MKYFLMLGCICLSTSSFSQLPNTLLNCDHEFIVSTKETKIISSNNSEILQGINYSFIGKLNNIIVDTALNNVIVFLKFSDSQGLKEIISYNPEKDSTYWKHKSYAQSCDIVDDFTVLKFKDGVSGETKDFIIESKTGFCKAVFENRVMIPVPEKEIYLTVPLFNFLGGVTIHDKYTGIELGKSISTNDYIYSGYLVHDSLLMVKVNGILVFNKDYKLIWRSDLKTMQMNLGSLILTTKYGVGIGKLKRFAPSFIGPDYSFHLNSDIFIFKNNAILNDKDSIYSFDIANGKNIWESLLPEKTGISHIQKFDETKSYFFNTGICIKAAQLGEYSKPFYAIYNLINGSCEYLKVFERSKLIADILTEDNFKVLLLNNGIIELVGSTIINEIIFDVNPNYGEFVCFLDTSDKHFIYFDNINTKWTEFNSIKNTDNKYSVITSKGVILINRDLHITDFISADKLGFAFYESQKFKYIESYKFSKNFFSRDKLIKYNKETNENTLFDLEWNYTIDENRLYITEKESISIFDLE